MPQIQLGVTEIAVTFAGVIIAGFLWRLAALKMGDTAMSRAMLFVY